MACDPNQLVTQAKCFQCLSEQQLQMVITYLLCQISIGSGSSNFLQPVPYTVAPPPNPPDTSKSAVAFDPTGNLPTLWWNTSDLHWH